MVKVSEQLFKQQVGNKLKSIRQDKQLSLDAAAKLTGVSKAMLGQIERGESSPTINKLWQIASGLEVSFSSFFATSKALRQHNQAFPNDSKMKVDTLFGYQEDTQFEMFEIQLTDFHQQDSAPHSHGVIEHIVVLSGELAMLFDGEWHPLKQGECVRFFADQAHSYKAITETVRFQNIVYYP
ncbi:transcriptional regulator [Vibrio comitans NBRC 102076]|uniref:Transcriptional regulator n=1 Tax=Vibrio comitans NBRC 102076 TaxID=1219078 RepID=A0A4Y3IMW5_9VIBR|nr:transcriptional regulator [Vibrio comitans NBRC 102076]